MQKQQIHAIVAKNLKKIMGRNGITYPELARRCQVSVGMISKIANGQTGITISMAINLSKGLNIRPPAKRFIKHDGLSDSCGILKSCL